MANRTENWMAEFNHILPEDEKDRALVLDGSIEICPACGEMSAYAWLYVNAFDASPHEIDSASFKPDHGTIAHIGTASCFEWECGHCGGHIVEASSPINAPGYTHSED